VRGNTQFALDLYHKLAAEAEGNLFYSPYSISTALAMTFAGARGRTAAQMARALRFELDAERLHPAFGRLQDRLGDVQKQGHVQLSVANALWPMEGYPFLQAFLELTARCYGARTRPVDYRQAEAARHTINAWVEERTANKIQEVIPPGLLNELTRLVLVNAIYFKGDWEHPFDPSSTQDVAFWVTPERQVQAPTMTQKREFAYAEFDDLQAMELPYAGGDLSMVVLLPRERDGLAGLEAHLNPQTLDRWIEKMRHCEVRVYLPRFEATYFVRLDAVLRSLGMVDAFEDADLSGIDGSKELYLSAVLHKAYVATDEHGTEAAAATAVLVQALSMPAPVPEFRADHPFLYLIRERSTGSVLFVGRVVNPTGKEPKHPTPPGRGPGAGAALAGLR
jgi:serpin B